MNFELLNNLTKDYVLIVETLLFKLQEKIVDHGDKIYLNREFFVELLSKKDFISTQEKMKIWRSLGWISCDKEGNRYTKKIRVGNKTSRKIVIEKKPYETLKKILN